MPETRDISRAEMAVFSTEIGRGHPSYLDGVLEILQRDYPDVSYYRDDVFSTSRGGARAAWRLVRRLYRVGGKGGAVSAAYSRMRHRMGSGMGEGGFVSILGRDLKRRLRSFTGPVVVAHPILAQILAKDHKVIYQHGELAVPGEAAVHGCHMILAPLGDTAACFVRAGLSEEMLRVTGQCIENALVPMAEIACQKRLQRIRSDKPLTAALFTSGAYPKEHLERLRLAAISLVKSGSVVYLFSGQSRRVARKFTAYFNQWGMSCGTGVGTPDLLKIIGSHDRADENRAFASVFEDIDFFVAPAHERTNWSVGLGLPQIIVSPNIGSYAPLNAEIALSRGTALQINNNEEAGNLAETIMESRRSGQLAVLALNGWGNTEINGFERAARYIVTCVRSDDDCI